MLKHICNVSDENVVEQWSENIYYQYFCGESSFVCGVPCEASELVHFRKRIGEEGKDDEQVEIIFWLIFWKSVFAFFFFFFPPNLIC
jgi:hypothetical protein